MFSLRQLPLKNIKAHPVRTGILHLLTIILVLCLFCGLIFVLSMKRELSIAQARLGADVLIYPTQAMSKIHKNDLLMQGSPVTIWKYRSLLERISDCEHIAVLSWQIYIFDGDIKITAYEPETDFVVSPWLAEAQNFIPPVGTVIAGSNIDCFDNSVVIFQEEWPVSGLLLETGSELDEMIFISMDTLPMLIQAAEAAGITTYSKIDPQNMFSSALIRVDDKQNTESVTNWINIYIRKATAIRSEEILTKTTSDIQGQISNITKITVFAWIVLIAAQCIVQFMLMGERRRELYVWTVIGSSRKKTKQVLLQEALITHGTGTLTGSVISILLCFILIRKRMSANALDLRAWFLSLLFTLVLTIAVCCLSASAAADYAFRSMEKHKRLNL
ncbi:MAG: ABC transporter permease [Flexilinea sp.]|nr:ABC transporter permease [Flexilinea sp.]